jgi:hypothetical protein
MKPLIAVLACSLLVPALARAEAPPLVAAAPSRDDLDDAVDNAKAMRNAGAVLAAVGTAMAIGSVIGAAVNGFPVDCGGDPQCNAMIPGFNAAVGVAVVSSVLTSIGVPLLITGDARVHELRRARLAASADAHGARASLTVSF